ncbi:uncharacterized protein [Diadema setosum]|uniref:uncharacterized protein n=1 Tax=Diadema setosum TaxID=31175 RepID=UPI003B3B2750
MADYGNEVTLSDGRPISSLRVVDLKQELKKYGLSIAGSKSQLIERLKAQIELEEMKQAPVCEGGPNQGIVDDESVASNSFIQQYLKQQQELLKQRHAREVPTEDSVIPEGLTNQVEELNQSLSHSQSEEVEKVDEREEKNGEDQPDKETKPVAEEHSSGSRMSRRSRRQSAQQEEKEDRNAEVEQERKRSHRKRLRSRDSEQGNDDGMSHDRRLADEKNEDMKVTDGLDEETKPASEQDKDSKQPEKPAEMDSPTDNDVTAVSSADQEKESNEGEAPSAARAEDAREDSRDEETEKSVQETSDSGSRTECEVESQPVRQGEVEQKREVSRAEEPSEEKTDADQSTVAVPSQKEQKSELVTAGRSETGHEICDEQAKSMPKEQGEQIGDVVKEGHSEDKKMDTATPVSEPAHREQRSETNEQMETGGNQEPGVEPGVESRDGNVRDPRDAAGNNSDQKEKKESAPQQHQESNSQRRVKLNRSGDLSRARGREEEKPDWKSEETGATVAENVEGLEKAKEEASSDALVERGSDSSVSPRKRPAWEKEEADAINDESDVSSKRRKAEADGDVKPEQTLSEEEGGVPKEDKSSTSGEMGKGEGRTAATSNTTETEDGEIKEEGEGTEEVAVEGAAVEGAAKEERDAKEEKTEDQVPKVDLVEQRSRVRPIITSSAPVKTKRDSFTSKDKAGDKDQGQEGSSDVKATSPAQASAPPVKKRRWGTTKKTSDDLGKNTNVNISTQLLKGIIPDIKVPPSEVLALEQEDELMDVEEAAVETQKGREVEKKMETEPAEEEPASNEPPKRKFIRQTITAPGAPADEESDIDYEDDEMTVRKVKQKGEGEEEGKEGAEAEDESSDSSSSSSSGSDSDEDDEEGKEEGSGDEDGQKKKKKKAKKDAAAAAAAKEAEKEGKPETKVVKMQRLKTAVRTVIDEPVRQTQREPSPSKRPESKIVHVINLVRPFTLVQLKELLGRYGTLTEGGFWINNIKSHCYATYETTEGAVACRASLHGTTWPSSNPKTLRIEFADQNELNRHMGVAVQKEETRAEPSPERTPAPVRGDRISAQDRERDAEQERRTRERERERERARKEREWDRGKERSQSRERRRRQRSQERRERHEEAKKEVEEPPAKLLDDLFRKTKATPCIYWLPLTEDMIVEREKQRASETTPRGGGAPRDAEGPAGDKERERERPRGPRYRSRSRDRRSRSRSRGRRR